MIDTIAIRIHGLERHSYLVKHLTKSEISGVEYIREDLHESVGLFLPTRWKEYTYNHSTGKRYTRAYRNAFKSHSQEINYSIQPERDFLHMEFSLCKYFHGDNVHQLVPHASDKWRLYFNTGKWYELAALHFKVFQGAFANFIAREFGEIEFDWSYVEIAQLDLCFNYVFQSQGQCELYLEFIREVKKPYAREGKSYSAYGPSSIYYASNIATFKIYHKGPELDAHPGEYKKKANWRAIRDLAYRSLRFEMAFKPPSMRELWMKRSKYKPMLLAYRRWMKEGKFIFNRKVYTVGQDHGNRKEILDYGKKLDKRWQFFIGGDVSEFENRACFDPLLFSEMVKYFWKISSKFMLQGAGKLNVVKNNVEYYDDFGKVQVLKLKGISPSRVKMFAVMLRTHTWDEIARKKILSRAQLARYKKFFKEVGYGEANTIEGELTNLDHTYQRYYDALSAIEHTKPMPFL